MKPKFIFCLFSLCCLLFIGLTQANAKVLFSGAGITLCVNDVPFKRPIGPEQGHRSIPIEVPISAFLNDNSVELDFLEAVGEIEIVISQDGTIVYSSSENVESSMVKSIQLPQNASGNFMIEIKGDNGAYAYGWFNLN